MTFYFLLRNINYIYFILYSNDFANLSMNELEIINGGDWSWKELGKSTVSGAVGGAAAYAVCGWW